MRPASLGGGLLAGLLLASCGGGGKPAPDAATKETDHRKEKAREREGERTATGERLAAQAKADADEAVRAKRDAEELQRILELRRTDPAEAERRENEFLTRRCRSDEDARSCSQLARKYANEGRYAEAKEAVRTGMSILEGKPGSASASRARQIEELRQLDEELDRRNGNWVEKVATPHSGIGLSSGSFPSR